MSTAREGGGERAICPDGALVLEGQTVTTTETVTHCADIEAGAGYAVESPGDVTFEAHGTVVLKDGFSVGDGARFVASSGGAPELSRRTFTYQSPQYFLTGASRPWGELSWTYDRIGNRLTETRDGTTDAYTYLANAAGGNTPTLDLISLAVGGTRDYTYGPAGHLEEVVAGANVIDFTSDAEGRLATAGRDAADVSASFEYDGRSYLTQAVESTGDPPTQSAAVESVYDSQGLLQALQRRPSPSDPEELVVHVYLAGRPVAQLTIAGDSTEAWTYLTTDHLGTPLLATDNLGGVVWEGGFEPFGRDYQEGTPAGALDQGLNLRLPGQWHEETWAAATSGAGLHYNVHRFYGPDIGRYARTDPAPFSRGVDIYSYARQNPLRLTDPLGLEVTSVDPRLKPFLDCALKESALAAQAHRHFQQDDTDWEIRVLGEGERDRFGRNARILFGAAERGTCVNDCSTVDPPGIFPWPFNRPGRFWIFPSGSGCEPVMESLIHELHERATALRTGRPHQEVHDEIVIPSREDAERACRECCPKPTWE